MNDQRLYCDELDCERPVAGHGSDKCSTHRRQLSRTGKCTPIAEKLTPEERAIAAGTAMLEADSDEEYATRRRAWLVACKALGAKDERRMLSLGDLADELRRRRSIEVKNGLSAARSRGVRLGRPAAQIDRAEFDDLFRVVKSPTALAIVFRVSRATIYRFLKKVIFETPASGPRADGESR